MPTYQYACTNPACGQRFELVQKFTDPAASECPVCSGPVRKVFSSVGVVFKGSGFYRTDSRSGGGAVTEGASAGSAKESASKDSGSSSSSTDSSSSSSSSGSGSGSGSATSTAGAAAASA